MDLLPEIEQRFSVREFTADEVDRAAIDRIVEAGRRAPSAKNRQPWRFIVAQDGALRQRLQDACFGQEWVGIAPVTVALCTTNVDYKMPNGQLAYPVDLSIAGSFMSLQAVREGLGTCMITTFDEQEVKSILTVPYSMRVVMLITMGYSDAEKPHLDRLPTDRIVAFDHW